jgi:phosphohistidine phosphatase SixA
MRLFAVLLLLACASTGPAAAADPWDALRQGGTVAILRHARAPGTGDPKNFRLDDCATQRNLSEEGRTQARRIGERFRAAGVRVSRVLSSRWCRCLETGRLAFGSAEPFAPLDSLFPQGTGREAPTQTVRDTVRAWAGQPGVLVLVTHQVNITELTGVYPAEGDILVLKPNPTGFEVAGTLR